jgi:hypothetical protein
MAKQAWKWILSHRHKPDDQKTSILLVLVLVSGASWFVAQFNIPLERKKASILSMLTSVAALLYIAA